MYAQKTPRLILGLAVFAHETDELALEFSAPMQHWINQFRKTGVLSDELASEKEAVELLKSSAIMKRMVNPAKFPQYIVGKADTVAAELKTIQAVFGAEEIIIRIMSANQKNKLKSLELLTKYCNAEK